MIAGVGMTIQMKCTDTEAKSLIRVANGNVLIAMSMSENQNLVLLIAERKIKE